MKKKGLMVCFFILLFLNSPALAKFPVHLGGFTLGEDIKNLKHLMDMETCREIAFNPYLGEGEILAQPGFKSGQIAYGLCDTPDKILRIKLKFADPSRDFFEKLLRVYKEKLGQPDEYRGDPFQTMIAWKWSFTNDQNEKSSLILQHNIMVEDEKMGNAVKLTLTSRIEKERDCYMEKFPEKQARPVLIKKTQKELWDVFVPY